MRINENTKAPLLLSDKRNWSSATSHVVSSRFLLLPCTSALFLILFRPAFPFTAQYFSLCPAYNKKVRFSYKIGMNFSLPVSAMDLFILIRIKNHALPELVRRDQVGFRVMCFHLNCNHRSVFEIKRFNNIFFTLVCIRTSKSGTSCALKKT